MSNTLHDALFAPLATRETVLIERPGAAPVTGAEFYRMARGAAGALISLGLQPGDRIAVQAPKSVEFLALYAGAVMAGVIFLPLNTAYTPAEVRYFVEDAGARLLVCDPKDAARLAEIASGAGAELHTLDGTGGGTLVDLFAPELARVVPRGPGDLAAFLYTSGTTGRSKGAMLTHDNLLSNAETLAEAWQFTDGDVLLHALPVFHTHGLFVATNVILATGGAMILLPKFDPDAVLAALPRATTMMGVPTFYTRLLDDPRFTRDLAGHMRLFVSGSAPLLAATHEAFEALTGHRILERYGMTETNMNTSNPYAGDRRAGTVGPPLPGVALRVMGPDGPLPPGEIGVIEVRGRNVFKGYWNMPEKTAEELRPDGWFITGDLGVQSEDGYVTIVGRGKDLIISGGLNVYPKEVEEAIDALPGVTESAVIGVPHPDFGEAVVAVVVAEGTPDVAGPLAERLAKFKQPKHIAFVDELPRNTMGKVQKAALRETYKGLFAAT